MTKLDLFNELAYSIDKDIRVYNSDVNYSSICDKEIYITKSNKGIETYVKQYLDIDFGFKYYNYCSYDLFIFLHELGHIENGWIEPVEYYLIGEKLEQYTNYYKAQYEYSELKDEIFASSWAMDFIKKNKKMIKRLDEEMRRLK